MICKNCGCYISFMLDYCTGCGAPKPKEQKWDYSKCNTAEGHDIGVYVSGEGGAGNAADVATSTLSTYCSQAATSIMVNSNQTESSISELMAYIDGRTQNDVRTEYRGIKVVDNSPSDMTLKTREVF